jgi:hypothetical protein
MLQGIFSLPPWSDLGILWTHFLGSVFENGAILGHLDVDDEYHGMIEQNRWRIGCFQVIS